MFTIIFIIIYLLGVIATFGKACAADYEQIEKVIEEHVIGEIEIIPWYRSNNIGTIIIYLGCSWLSFIYMLIYFTERKYFLKYNYKGLQ